jgi:nucleoside-diphosphate-sugar epimerase
MARIMVAGATGTVGRRVVEDLINSGHEVIAVARNKEPLQELRPLGDEKSLQLAVCDLLDTEAASNLAKQIAGVEALVHVASPPPADEQDHRFCKDQVFMAVNLIALFGATIERAVVGSCTSVLGDEDKGSMSTHGTYYPTTYHGSSLQATEQLWNLYAVDSGKPVTCVRFAPSMIRKGTAKETETGGELSAIGIMDASKIVVDALGKAESGLITLNPGVEIR